MKDLEIGTRVCVTEKRGRAISTWTGIIKTILNNVVSTKPENKKDFAGYGIKPEGEQSSLLKVRHHSMVSMLLSDLKDVKPVKPKS